MIWLKFNRATETTILWIKKADQVLYKALLKAILHIAARLVKLVDTRDLKSLGRKALPVQVRQRAP